MVANNDRKPILFNYFNDTAKILLAKYNRSAQQKAVDNIGANREAFCSNFLEKVLPTKLNFCKGEIWDSKESKTGQLDTIITRDDAPILEFEERNVYLVEGVFAVIEIKSKLDSAKIRESKKTLEKVRDLVIESPRGMQLVSGTWIDRPLRIIFAYDGIKWENLIKEIENNNCLELFDLICILKKGVYLKKGNLISWKNEIPFLIINGEAASLAYLYYYLTQYSQGFISNRITLNPYFEPFSGWDSV